MYYDKSTKILVPVDCLNCLGRTLLMAIEYSVHDAAGRRRYQDGIRITYSNWKYVLTVFCKYSEYMSNIFLNIS
jgi:hypothetical protein